VKLADYLDENGIEVADFAELVSQRLGRPIRIFTLTRHMLPLDHAEYRRPSKEFRQAYREETSGAVTADDFDLPDAAPSASRALTPKAGAVLRRGVSAQKSPRKKSPPVHVSRGKAAKASPHHVGRR
jgi:hypothetical protein